jgi:hypothetical protein
MHIQPANLTCAISMRRRRAEKRRHQCRGDTRRRRRGVAEQQRARRRRRPISSVELEPAAPQLQLPPLPVLHHGPVHQRYQPLHCCPEQRLCAPQRSAGIKRGQGEGLDDGAAFHLHKRKRLTKSTGFSQVSFRAIILVLICAHLVTASIATGTEGL